MNSQKIKKTTENVLQSFIKGKEWVDKDYLNRYLSSISDLRKFFNDITTLSIAIVGLVIPILIQSNIPLDKIILFISVIFFSIEIILWIILRFYIVEKEIEKWPIEFKKVEDKFNQTITDLKELIKNPTPELSNQKWEIIEKRYSKETANNTEKSSLNNLLDIVFNIDYWLLGLFIVAFILFIISFWPLFSKTIFV